MNKQLRLTEWTAALVIFVMGLISLAYPQTFHRPSLTEFIPYAVQWTWLCLIVGGFRISALWVNGHWKGGTPALRVIGAIFGAAMFGAIAGNILGALPNDPYGLSWGFGTYTVLMVMEVINTYHSMSDLANVKKYGG